MTTLRTFLSQSFAGLFRNLLICNLRINNENLRICGLAPFSNFSNLRICKSGMSPRVCGFACPPLTSGPYISYSGPRYFISGRHKQTWT
jgi:hypothetical protein